jgi:acid phosphatase type 7
VQHQTGRVPRNRPTSKSGILSLCVLLGCVAFASTLLIVLLGKEAQAAQSRVEAETMTLSGSNVVVHPWDTASSGQEVAFYTRGSASSSFDGAATNLYLRARGTDCQGDPQLKVYVDDALEGTVDLTSGIFADYAVPLSDLSSGTHTLRVSFENDFHDPGVCDRNAYLDYYLLTLPENDSVVEAAADTQIVESAASTNYGDATIIGADGDWPAGSGQNVYSLIRWDLSGIAPGTNVDTASMSLTVAPNTSPQTYEVYALKRPWSESEATWNFSAAGEPWQVAGAKGSLDRTAAAGTATPSSTGEMDFALSPALVQRWVDDPTSNHGIIIADAANGDGFNFYSRESDISSQRPRLTLTPYTGDPILVGAAKIGNCRGQGDEATAQLLDGMAGTVFTAGDNAYPDGTAANFAECYDPSWGRHIDRTRPTLGHHDYFTEGATGYFDYFGEAAGAPTKGYYSYDTREWHVIALNSLCSQVGGCDSTSPMVNWLEQDLAANPNTCTLAYFNHALFSSGRHGNASQVKPIWNVLYAAGADVVVNGRDHSYERFAPQDPNGALDKAKGIREFVVGTGGAGLFSFDLGTIKPNSEARNDHTYGVLTLTLHPSSYDWQFVPVAGKTFTDSGTTSCH